MLGSFLHVSGSADSMAAVVNELLENQKQLAFFPPHDGVFSISGNCVKRTTSERLRMGGNGITYS